MLESFSPPSYTCIPFSPSLRRPPPRPSHSLPTMPYWPGCLKWRSSNRGSSRGLGGQSLGNRRQLHRCSLLDHGLLRLWRRHFWHGLPMCIACTSLQRFPLPVPPLLPPFPPFCLSHSSPVDHPPSMDDVELVMNPLAASDIPFLVTSAIVCNRALKELSTDTICTETRYVLSHVVSSTIYLPAVCGMPYICSIVCQSMCLSYHYKPIRPLRPLGRVWEGWATRCLPTSAGEKVLGSCAMAIGSGFE